MSMVLTREGCREPYWKERFVAGLPLVFAERVKENLQTEYPDVTLKDLTYGRISAMVKNTGVALCNTMKIENRIKRNQQIGIKELGDFCMQYGYEKITPPSTSKRKILRKHKISPKTPYKNQQTKKWTPKGNVKKSSSNNNNPQIDKSKIVCYKCGRLGHYKKDCMMKEKINELEISDELKDQIAKILLETSDEEEIIEEIEEKSDTSEDEEYEEIEYEEIECEEENCNENCSCRYTINMISKELKRTLEMIDSIEDPEEKFK